MGDMYKAKKTMFLLGDKMERLNIYVKNFSIAEWKELSLFEGYEIQEYPICLEDKRNLETDVPALFVLREPKDETSLWQYIRYIHEMKMNATILLLLKNENFSLLYKACQCGITTVLLEPAAPQEVQEQVQWCLGRIKNVAGVLKERAVLEEYEYQKQHKIVEKLLDNILKKPEEVAFLLPEINKRYGTKLGEGYYQAMLLAIDRRELYTKSSPFIKDVVLLMFHTFYHAKELIVGHREQYGLIAIVYYEENVSLIQRKEEYELFMQRLKVKQKQYGAFSAVLSVGNMVEGMGVIGDSIAQAMAVREYWMQEKKEILFAERKMVSQQLDAYITIRKIKELIRFVSLGEVRHVNGWFLDFHQNIEPRFLSYPPAFGLFIKAIYDTGILPEWKMNVLYYTLDGVERVKQLEQLLLEACHLTQQGDKEKQEVAAQAIAYMKVHYAEPINLDYIAEKCGMSTSYFSRKFKEQTGEKYIDVLTDIRVREAQRMLGTTDMSVIEIVEAVGYCDDKHFRRVFYKLVGMNPLEYRKKIREKDKLSENNI